jgi:RNA polymerase sigma factor (sigma-70 family)
LKEQSTEHALLEGLAKNDRKAIESLYKNNYKMVQSLVISNNGSADDAKDIFQEAMVVLYEKARSGTFELNCLIRTYLYSVSRRLWLKRLLHQNRFTLNDVEDESIPVEDDLADHERKDLEFDMMDKALGGLGEPCKSLLEAFYLQKRNMQEIASSFGYTNADNAKNQKYKCLMRLKKAFFTHYKTDL